MTETDGYPSPIKKIYVLGNRPKNALKVKLEAPREDV
jgi:hypothetical protein